MMLPLLSYILDYLQARNPAQTSKLRLRIGNENAEWEAKVDSFFSRYKAYIESRGLSLDYGLDCYLKLSARMAHERMEFLRSGRYASSSFADVEQQIYLNPEVFEYHMHGLVFAQFFWPEQSARFQFFCQHIEKELVKGGRYLEIGGGHALYILEAMRRSPANTRFSLLDISPSSMELAKGIARDEPIEFRLMNIFDYPIKEKFEFITMGEVIEHVEDPLSLLRRVRNLLAPGGGAFISAPTNSATIDHIYLFSSTDEIRAMLEAANFRIVREATRVAENMSEERARKLKVAVMFAAFVAPN